MRELDAQDARLERVEPGVVADVDEGALVLGAVEAVVLDLLGERVVVGRDRAAVAEGAEVLGREEREGGDRAERAWAATVGQPRARGLRGVLDHREAERGDLLDRGDVAEQVHGDHGLGLGRDHLAHVLGRHQERRRVDVAPDRPRAEQRDRLGRGEERERGDDHLVPRADAQRAQREQQRVGAVGHPERVLGADVARELVLEAATSGPKMKRLDAMISATLAAISDSSGASGVAVSKSGTAMPQDPSDAVVPAVCAGA